MAPIHRVSPGSYFNLPPAALWNAMQEVGDWWLRQRKIGGSESRPRFPPIMLKNGTGAGVPAGHALQITSNLVTTIRRESPWFNADYPDPDGSETFAVTLRAMPIDAIDECQVAGGCYVRLNVNHIQQQYCDIDSSQTLLQSKWHGRGRIIWKATGSTGEQDAYIVLGEMFRGPIKVVATSGISSGSHANCAVYWGGVAASPAATIDCWLNWANGGSNVGTLAQAFAHYFPDEKKYVITGAEC